MSTPSTVGPVETQRAPVVQFIGSSENELGQLTATAFNYYDQAKQFLEQASSMGADLSNAKALMNRLPSEWAGYVASNPENLNEMFGQLSELFSLVQSYKAMYDNMGPSASYMMQGGNVNNPKGQLRPNPNRYSMDSSTAVSAPDPSGKVAPAVPPPAPPAASATPPKTVPNPNASVPGPPASTPPPTAATTGTTQSGLTFDKSRAPKIIASGVAAYGAAQTAATYYGSYTAATAEAASIAADTAAAVEAGETVGLLSGAVAETASVGLGVGEAAALLTEGASVAGAVAAESGLVAGASAGIGLVAEGAGIASAAVAGAAVGTALAGLAAVALVGVAGYEIYKAFGGTENIGFIDDIGSFFSSWF